MLRLSPEIEQLTREIAQRDGGRCIICETKILIAAHFIYDQQLFTSAFENGFHRDNAVTLCQDHINDALDTTLSTEQLKKASFISHPLHPSILSLDENHDRYGNVILRDGARLKGPLMDSPEVTDRLARAGMMSKFTSRFQYPPIPHVPWSKSIPITGAGLKSMNHMKGKEVVLTLHMKSENSALSRDELHALTFTGKRYAAGGLIKTFYRQIVDNMAISERIIGENLSANHAVAYYDMPSYLLGMQIWHGGFCLPYNQTLTRLEELGITPVRELWRGIYDEKVIRSIQATLDSDVHEGTLLRTTSGFSYRDFHQHVAMYSPHLNESMEPPTRLGAAPTESFERLKVVPGKKIVEGSVV